MTTFDLTGKATVSWQAARSVEFDCAELELDGGCVVFHRRAGQTPSLNAASATLLQQIPIAATGLNAAYRSVTSVPAWWERRHD